MLAVTGNQRKDRHQRQGVPTRKKYILTSSSDGTITDMTQMTIILKPIERLTIHELLLGFCSCSVLYQALPCPVQGSCL